MSYLNEELLNICVNNLGESYHLINKNDDYREFYGFLQIILRCFQENPDLINIEIKEKIMNIADIFVMDISESRYVENSTEFIEKWMIEKNQDAYAGDDCYDEYIRSLNEFKAILRALKNV